jgi:DNA-binding response OmpR family regulator
MDDQKHVDVQAAQAKIVMVVDADILARMAIADYLRDCGYRVIEAVSGREVRAVLEAGHTIEVLLIDMQLHSSEDGFALARSIRADHPEIIVIRTSSTAKLADKAADLCDEGPLAKPYNPRELLLRIESLRRRQPT